MSTTNLTLVYGVLLYEGMSILDIYTLLEFLNVISLDLPVKIHLISTESSDIVSTKVGQSYVGNAQRMVADFSLENAPDVDVIVIPGGTVEDVISSGRVARFLKARYPVSTLGTNVTWIPKARFMNDGNIWTSSGLTAGLDLSYALIKEVYGTEVAEKAATVLEYIPSEDPLTDPFAVKYGLV